MIVVNPNNRNASPTSAIEPPIWCAYIASFGEDNEILDAELEGLSIAETAERIGFKPVTLVAMGANPSASSTPKAGIIRKLFPMLPYGAGVVGQHYGYMPDMSKRTPNWDLVDFSKYRAHNWHCLDGSDRGNYGVVYTSFGCPFDCYYCNIHTLYKGVTFRNPQDVVNEITDLAERHHVRNLKVCDELFVLNPTHVNEVCDLLIERNYNLNVWAYARVDTVTPFLLEKMKRAGFSWLCYGFEAGDGDILEGVNKNQTMKQMFDAVAMTHEAGINVLGNFIFGLPDDTEATMYATRQLAKQLQCDYVNFYCAMAYPGSQLYEDTPKENLPDKWEDYDQYSPNLKPLPTKHLTSQQVRDYRDEAFKKYFSDKHYLSRIEQKFGQQAVDHIKEMLEWSPR